MGNSNPVSSLDSKQKIANNTVVFFKAFRWSSIIAICVFILLWAAVYQVPRPINPNDPGGSVSHFQRVCYHVWGSFYDPVVALSSDSIRTLKREWTADKTKDSLLISFLTFIGFPILNITIKSMSSSKKWLKRIGQFNGELSLK